MDLAFNILLIIHLLSLIVGGATGVTMPVIVRYAERAEPGTRAMLMSIGGKLSTNSRIALLIMIASGILMLWLRYGGAPTALGPWFLAKLGFVGLILAATVVALVLGRERINPRIFGAVVGLSLLAIVICSVMTFS